MALKWYILVQCMLGIGIIMNATAVEAILDGLHDSLGTMNQQVTKFIEELQANVDIWATKVLINANDEECFYMCPKGKSLSTLVLFNQSLNFFFNFLGIEPMEKENYTFVPGPCSTFGFDVSLC